MATDNDYLAQEYLHLQKVVEDFDGKALTVKAWSVTFSAAAIGLAFFHNQRAVVLVAAVSAVAFWFVEALLKTNQQAYYQRIEELEGHFSLQQQHNPFQTGRAWKAAFESRGGYRYAGAILCWPHVFMPHAPIALVATLLWLMYGTLVRV